jgi:branched-chain amino acid transport system permease protein
MRDITGGTMGLYNIPALTIGSFPPSEFRSVFYYYVIMLIFLTSSFTNYKIMYSSNISLALTAIRDSPSRAKSLGINPIKYTLIAFSVSCFFTGLAGAFYGHYFGFVDVNMINFSTLIMLFLMIIVGGRGSLHGATIGAFIWTIAAELLRPLEILRFAALGLLIIFFIIFLPSGIFPILRKTWNFVVVHTLRRGQHT